MLMAEPPPPPRPIAVVPVGRPPKRRPSSLAQELRHAGFAVELGYSGNLSRRMKRAKRIKPAPR